MPAVQRDMSGRVAIQHAVNRIVDDLDGYGLLSDIERLDNLLAAANEVAYGGPTLGRETHIEALVRLAAEAQLWAETLQAGARR